MSLLKSLAKILCCGWFLVRILIWSLILGISGRFVVCKGMFRFIMSSGAIGLLITWKASRYGDMFLRMGNFGDIFRGVDTFVDHQ